MSDFRECVIIPLAMFERCNFRSGETSDKAADVLFDKSLPSDLKMKLYHQRRQLAPPQSNTQKVEIVKPTVEVPHQLAPDIESIVQEFSSKKVPYASIILSKIVQHPESISWNDKFEVTINGVHYPGSNIIELLRFVLGEKVTTSSLDIPPAASKFYSILSDIGVSSSWMKKPKQVGLGWIAF